MERIKLALKTPQRHSSLALEPSLNTTHALPARSRRPGLSPRTHLAVLGGFALLTIILTYPIAWHLFTEVPGGGDAWQHIWNLWWVKRALVDQHTNPYFTDLLYYPDGVNLYLHTLVLTAGLIGIPLQLIGFNLIATYNIILLSSFLLAGYGTFLLCHYLTGNRWASFAGGIVFAFAPYHFAHLFGHMNLASLQWIPFYVLVLLRATDEPGRYGSHAAAQTFPEDEPTPRSLRRFFTRNSGIAWAVCAGALLAVNAYTDLVYGVFLVLFTAILVAWKVLVPAERWLSRQMGLGWREGAVRLLAGSAVVLILMSPILLPTLAEAQKPYAQQPPRETLFYSSDLVLAFSPSELHPIWGADITRFLNGVPPYLPLKNPSERGVFLGYVVLLVSAFAGWRLRYSRQVRFWAFTAFLTWLLSLGPVLQVLGRTQFTLFQVNIPLPYLLLTKLPLVSVMRTPSRLTVLTMLALSVLVTYGLALIARWKYERSLGGGHVRRWFLGYTLAEIVLPVLIIFEFLPYPAQPDGSHGFPMVPPGWDVPIYSKIAQEPGRFALLELPLRPFGDYMAYQTIHGKPIIGGYLSRQPPYPTEENTPVLRYLMDGTDPNDPLKAQVSGGKGVQELKALNVRYAIIRWWAFTPEQKSAMQSKLSAIFARPPDYSYAKDQVDAWELN